jgi:nucleotide-binding universal stress UspA family protein
MIRLMRVVIAVDGSDVSIDAARRAVELLGRGCQYTLLEVIRVAVPMAVGAAGWAPGQAIPPSPEMMEHMAEREAQSARADLADVAAVLGQRAARRVEVGEPGATICAVAAAEHADLIVVGSHGKGAWKQALLGSVSRHVVHRAPCPVMIVRPLEEAP